MCRAGFALIESRNESLARMMCSALRGEPRFSYVVPDEQTRSSVLQWFFRSVAIPVCSANGEIHTTEDPPGGAFWIRPGESAAFRESLHSEIAAAPFDLGSTSARRACKLLSRIHDVHSRLVRGPHWYLLAHVGHAAIVLKPVLSRADSEGLPCYVEVFDERNLPLYISLGFQFCGAGRVPGGGPNFWSMLRPPQNQIKM